MRRFGYTGIVFCQKFEKTANINPNSEGVLQHLEHKFIVHKT